MGWSQALQQIKAVIPLAVFLCRIRKPNTWEKTGSDHERFAYLPSALEEGGGACAACVLRRFTTPSGCPRAGTSPAPVAGLSPESSVCGFNKQVTLHPGKL